MATRPAINFGRCWMINRTVKSAASLREKQQYIRQCSTSEDRTNKGNKSVVNKVDISQPRTYKEMLALEAREYLDNLSPELIERQEELFALMDMLRYQGYEIPDANDISDTEMASILQEWNTKSPAQRLHHAQYKIKMGQERIEPMLSIDEERSHALKTTFETLKSFNAIRSYMHGQPLIIDAGYTLHSTREAALVHNILAMQYFNNINKLGFHLHVTGFKCNTQLTKMKDRNVTDYYMMDFHEENFWEIFPREKLVYLTPDAPEGKEYCSDKIYVIGGLPDKSVAKHHRDYDHSSYTRAKELGMSCMSFPFSCYFRSHPLMFRNLRLLPVMKLLLSAEKHNDWGKALIERYGFKFQKREPFVFVDGYRQNSKHGPSKRVLKPSRGFQF